MLIDQDAVPTLVEVKRGESRETRRQVVGQMLDYAAHATSTWDVGDIRRSFEESRVDADEVLCKLLDSDEEPDADSIWDSVGRNLAAKRVRLLFVADEIPETLERVVGFLNEKMPNIEVLAVEIKRFSGETNRQMLVPRVIGRVVSTSAGSMSAHRTVLTQEKYLEGFAYIESRRTAERLLEEARRSGAILNWGRVPSASAAEVPYIGTP